VYLLLKEQKIMPRRKKKLKDLSQTHGKSEEIIPSTLDQVWGDTGMSKFGTLNEEEYETELGGYSKTDLFAHAAKVGIVPVDNRELLEKRLIREFQRHVLSYRKPKQVSPLVEQEALSKKVKKILEEGR
jgi:hypothetical protein